jgi:hypothetical protein
MLQNTGRLKSDADQAPPFLHPIALSLSRAEHRLKPPPIARNSAETLGMFFDQAAATLVGCKQHTSCLNKQDEWEESNTVTANFEYTRKVVQFDSGKSSFQQERRLL